MLKFKVIHKKDFSFHCYTTTINHRFTTTYHNGVAALNRSCAKQQSDFETPQTAALKRGGLRSQLQIFVKNQPGQVCNSRFL